MGKVAVTQEPLPCPFCGGGRDLDIRTYVVQPDDYHGGYVECSDCDTRGASAIIAEGWLGSPDEARAYAIAAWNRRTPDEATRIATAEACARIADEQRSYNHRMWDRAAAFIATAIRLQQGSEKP